MNRLIFKKRKKKFQSDFEENSQAKNSEFNFNSLNETCLQIS